MSDETKKTEDTGETIIARGEPVVPHEAKHTPKGKDSISILHRLVSAFKTELADMERDHAARGQVQVYHDRIVEVLNDFKAR